MRPSGEAWIGKCQRQSGGRGNGVSNRQRLEEAQKVRTSCALRVAGGFPLQQVLPRPVHPQQGPPNRIEADERLVRKENQREQDLGKLFARPVDGHAQMRPQRQLRRFLRQIREYGQRGDGRDHGQYE